MKGKALSESKPLPKPTRNPQALEILAANEADVPLATARQVTGPRLASALVETAIAKKLTGFDIDLTETRRVLREAADKIKGGDLSDVESMLYSQASALNLMFAEMNRRALGALYDGASFEAGKAYMGISLKTQNQCRMTLETLGNIKNPPAVFAKQANIAHGPQQVNNNAAPRAPATENQNQPSKLVEAKNETPMDTGTTGNSRTADSQLEAVDTVNRAKVG